MIAKLRSFSEIRPVPSEKAARKRTVPASRLEFHGHFCTVSTGIRRIARPARSGRKRQQKGDTQDILWIEWPLPKAEAQSAWEEWSEGRFRPAVAANG